MNAKHTPGPWRWELNEEHKSIHLVGGRPQYDLTILEPTRWGMGSATMMIRDTAHDGMNIMHKLHERRDWIAPFLGRGHHAKWCANVVHPDMRLISAAPDLLGALQRLVGACDGAATSANGVTDPIDEGSVYGWQAVEEARRAIAKATGNSVDSPITE